MDLGPLEVSLLRRPFGLQVVTIVGAGAFLGGAMGAAIWGVAGRDVETVAWYYVIAAAVVPVVTAAVFARIWWSGPRRDILPVSWRLWVGVCLVAGLGVGVYSGGLHELQNAVHWSAALGFMFLFPILALAASFGARFRDALPRLLALGAGLEVGAQVSLHLVKHGRLGWWDDISGMSAAFTAGAIVFAIPIALLRRRLLALAQRRSGGARAPIDGESMPRRAG